LILEGTAVNKLELEERLIDFSVMAIDISNELPNTKAGNHLAGQLIRSGTSVALNYGEAQSGESRKDFVHKLKIVLKELRETLICLKIIKRTQMCKSEIFQKSLIENDELISIFVKSVETAQKNMEK